MISNPIYGNNKIDGNQTTNESSYMWLWFADLGSGLKPWSEVTSTGTSGSFDFEKSEGSLRSLDAIWSIEVSYTVLPYLGSTMTNINKLPSYSPIPFVGSWIPILGNRHMGGKKHLAPRHIFLNRYTMVFHSYDTPTILRPIDGLVWKYSIPTTRVEYCIKQGSNWRVYHTPHFQTHPNQVCEIPLIISHQKFPCVPCVIFIFHKFP